MKSQVTQAVAHRRKEPKETFCLENHTSGLCDERSQVSLEKKAVLFVVGPTLPFCMGRFVTGMAEIVEN